MAITAAPGYIVDPNNPNMVIRDPNYGAMPGSVQAIQQTNQQPSIAYGAVNNPISVSTLTSNPTPIAVTNPNVNYYDNVGTSSVAGATTPPPTPIPSPTPTPTIPEPQLSSFQNLLSKYLPNNFQMTSPTSTVDEYKRLQTESDIVGKTKEVNDLSAQLTEIKNKYDLAPIVLEKDAIGRGVTTDILNRQSSARQRDYAIEALPVTAALNAAQGRLDSANKNIQTLIGLVQTDQENTYKYQSDLLSRAMEFASNDQKVELQRRQEFLDTQKVSQTQLNTLKSGYISAAIEAGDYKTAGLMATAQDQGTLSSLASQIKNTNPDLQFVSGTDNQPAGYFNKTTGQFTPLNVGGGGTTIPISGLTPEQQADPFIQKLLSTKGGKALTDTPLQQINKGLTVLGQLGALQTNISNTKTGPILGAFKGANPWDTNAQTIKAQLNAIVPNLARGVYGEVGVLTDNDIKTYSKTIGNLTSTNDVNNAIMYITLDLIGKSIKNTLEVQAAGGRDVSKFVDIYTSMQDTKNSVLQSLPTNNQTLQQLGVTSQDEDIFSSVAGDSSYGGFFSNIWKGLTGN